VAKPKNFFFFFGWGGVCVEGCWGVFVGCGGWGWLGVVGRGGGGCGLCTPTKKPMRFGGWFFFFLGGGVFFFFGVFSGVFLVGFGGVGWGLCWGGLGGAWGGWGVGVVVWVLFVGFFLFVVCVGCFFGWVFLFLGGVGGGLGGCFSGGVGFGSSVGGGPQFFFQTRALLSH